MLAVYRPEDGRRHNRGAKRRHHSVTRGRETAQPERLLQAKGVASGWKPIVPKLGWAETARRLCAKHDSRQDTQSII